MSELTGKVIAVTGASSGIGEATARLLAERGAAVVLAARRAMDRFAMDPAAVARAIAFAIGEPHDVEISDLTIRPTVQGEALARSTAGSR